MIVVYDAGALIAADRGDRDFWADHSGRLRRGYLILTTAPVVAQVSRSARQVLLHRLLEGCEILPFNDGDAHAIGRLLADSGTSDVVDAHVALTAVERGAIVLTSDVRDIGGLVAQFDAAPPVVEV